MSATTLDARYTECSYHLRALRRPGLQVVPRRALSTQVPGARGLKGIQPGVEPFSKHKKCNWGHRHDEVNASWFSVYQQQDVYPAQFVAVRSR